MKIEIITDPHIPHGVYGTVARLEGNILYLTIDPDLDPSQSAYPVTIGPAS